MTRALERRFVTPGGVSLAATIVGPAAGPPVILSHGAGQTRHAWRATAHWLAGAGLQAIAVDMRGHGDSEWAPDGRYDRDALVGDLVGVAAALDRPPALVGASSGGMTSLLAVGEGRIDATAVVLVDVVPELELDGVDRIVSFMTACPDGFATLDDAAQAVADYLPHRSRPVTVDGLRKNLRRGADARWRWHWDPRFLGGALEERLRLTTRAQEAVAALEIPTLLVRGAASDVVSVTGVESFRQAAPHAEYLDVTGAGHMVAGDDNDRFGSVLVEFLVRHLLGTSHMGTH